MGELLAVSFTNQHSNIFAKFKHFVTYISLHNIKVLGHLDLDYSALVLALGLSETSGLRDFLSRLLELFNLSILKFVLLYHL